jgi:hypothetical protein
VGGLCTFSGHVAGRQVLIKPRPRAFSANRIGGMTTCLEGGLTGAPTWALQVTAPGGVLMSDRQAPCMQDRSGTQRARPPGVDGFTKGRRPCARRQVVSSVGHSPSYPGFSGDGKGLPAGSIGVGPCRPWGFRGRALSARARR